MSLGISTKLTLIRSEVILHKKIRIPRESAIEVMDALGKIDQDALEFIDLNKEDIEAKKNFADMIKRCDDIDRKLANLELYALEFGQNVNVYSSYRQFLTDFEQDFTQRDKRYGTYFDLVENEVLDEEKKVIDLISSYSGLKEEIEILSEKKCVFDKSSELISTNPSLVQFQNNQQMVVDEEKNYDANLQFLAGTIKADDDLRMKRMIFRSSRGRAIATYFDYFNEHDKNDQKVKKKIFTIFFQGGLENILKQKIVQIFKIFNASVFVVPHPDNIQEEKEKLNKKIEQNQELMKVAKGSIENFLKEKLGNEKQPGKLPLYKLYYKKEKMIYTNLNKCLLRDNFIDGEVWILEKKYEQIKKILRDILKEDESRMTANFIDLEDTNIARPTYIHSNEFLWAFQEIVNTYGIPRYREINPAYFNIVTFPFLFGIMFGDIGHGVLVLIFAIYLIFMNDAIKAEPKSILRPILKARYLFLLCGFFAFYCGFLYNDFLSVPLPLFGTCYENRIDNDLEYAIKTKHNCVYPFGLDPKWYSATNELAYFNSMKMKFSVIVGVSHMIFGIILKGINEIHFRNYMAFVFEFLPQLIFMTMLFGYMIVMIFIKWASDYTATTNLAPSLISQMMNIFLKLGSVQDKPLWGGIVNGKYVQENFHIIVLIVCLCMVPIMLLPKPIIIYLRKNKIERPPVVEENAGFGRLSDEQRLVFMKFNF